MPCNDKLKDQRMRESCIVVSITVCTVCILRVKGRILRVKGGKRVLHLCSMHTGEETIHLLLCVERKDEDWFGDLQENYKLYII